MIISKIEKENSAEEGTMFIYAKQATEIFFPLCVYIYYSIYLIFGFNIKLNFR
jgi:S-adenosylmethionine synthetase